jgi:pimeloyl-ACP methyl ester carboxylesterase/DNA-binding CsgD family transcriptional regulator
MNGRGTVDRPHDELGGSMPSSRTRVSLCRVPGGAQVAYAIAGTGRPLVFVPGWLCHLEQSFSHPSAASTRDRLAAERQFVWYDRLGCGLSDRDGFEPSIQNDVDQLVAVLDAVGADRADLIGYSFGAPPAAVLAARCPERVGRLVFCSAFARGSAVQTAKQLAALQALIAQNWGLASRTLATMLVPNASAHDLRWFSRFQKAAATAEMAIRLLDHQYAMDVRDVLPAVQAPTLVIHNRHDKAVPFEAGRELAALVPGAELHALEGNEHDPFLRDSGSVIDVILDFVEGRPIGSTPRPAPSGARNALGARPTARELEVLEAIALGSTNKEIAMALHVTVATVERHVTSLYRKLEARGVPTRSWPPSGWVWSSRPAIRWRARLTETHPAGSGDARERARLRVFREGIIPDLREAVVPVAPVRCDRPDGHQPTRRPGGRR